MLLFFVGFEQSPFKLTPEFVEIIDGPESDLFIEFRNLIIAGLKAARKHQDRLVNVVEIMRSSKFYQLSLKVRFLFLFSFKNILLRYTIAVL